MRLNSPRIPQELMVSFPTVENMFVLVENVKKTCGKPVECLGKSGRKNKNCKNQAECKKVRKSSQMDPTKLSHSRSNAVF